MEEENLEIALESLFGDIFKKKKIGRPRKFNSGIDDSKEHYKLYNKEHRKQNKEYYREFRRQWRKNNPDKVAAQNERDKKYKKDTKAHLKRFNLSADKYDLMLKKQNGKCAICGKTKKRKLQHNFSCRPLS